MSKKINETANYDGVINIKYLTPENAVFTRVNEFITLTLPGDEKPERGKVSLRRSFPYEFMYEYISVLDGDERELGMIRDVKQFPQVEELLKAELDRRYYTLKINKILHFKERYGFSYWKTETDRGPADFTLKDTYRSIYKIGAGHIAITDVDGNRYEIDDVYALDKASFKKIDIFL
ncbi:MAG: DUF1854 domain-containing protein [Oscillospiraceae bacterium]|nr:DUF1854 domain-containing protein [Oscillospiraceae bacterium]